MEPSRRPSSTRSPRSAINSAAGRAAPMIVTGVLSLAAALDLLRLPTGAAPVRVAFVVLVQAVAIALTVALDRPGPRPYWQMALFVTLILMPILALQAYVSRIPFVAIARGSAGPLLWLTLATVVALCGMWLFAVHQADETPENGALLFLPAAVLVPAILGAPESIGETSALGMLGEASLVAGVTIFLGLLSPPNWRPIAGGTALAVQFLLLWSLGRGPVHSQDGGAIVPVSAGVLLAVTALLIVLTPVGALFSRRFFQTVAEESGERRPASVPARGARRSGIR